MILSCVDAERSDDTIFFIWISAVSLFRIVNLLQLSSCHHRYVLQRDAANQSMRSCPHPLFYDLVVRKRGRLLLFGVGNRLGKESFETYSSRQRRFIIRLSEIDQQHHNSPMISRKMLTKLWKLWKLLLLK
ncbi:uncharacterized protein LOC126880124 isoform X1 [Diabrotica virgifera virgifera]|uniref:Uncharacterized protein n=1 Tax=Diabrotica virgifera virgifera TaxID=50390 RepID=A0ABM5JPC8_DIAVI|nr:uncharacterized protein LOC126880124 isoform X1 [Diabrotica virgifera virgifera]